jgi:hypothetical protein
VASQPTVKNSDVCRWQATLKIHAWDNPQSLIVVILLYLRREVSWTDGHCCNKGLIATGDVLVLESAYIIINFINMNATNQILKHSAVTTATTLFQEAEGEACACYLTDIIPSNNVVKYESILDFLAKPVVILNTDWSTASLQGDSIWSSLATALLSNTYWSNKLQGFQYFRGTLHIKVQINPNPFQQGALILSFIPLSNDVSTADGSVLSLHTSNLSGLTQLPHTTLLCKDTVTELSIPYISPYEFWDRGDDSVGSWGKVMLNVLSPLVTGAAGETTVGLTIYGWFTDVELAGPMVPQSMAASKLAKRRKKKPMENIPGQPISFALSKTAQLAKDLTAIPMLAPITGPAQWVLNAASGLASSFGWSKPSENSSTTIVATVGNRYSATSDGVDIAVPLGLSATNEITMTDKLSVYDQDEMSINFLKKVYGYVGSISLSTADATGTRKTFGPFDAVSPSNMCGQYTKTVAPKTVTYNQGPPIYFLSRFFRLWRGSIKFKLKFIKTNFHSGRIMLTYTPRQGVVTVPTAATSVIALREIIDLRDLDEYEVEIPYLLPKPYQDIYDPGATNVNSMGTLALTIINELRAPETCSQTIQILVYASGGDDFEFALPYDAPLVFSPEMELNEEETISDHVIADFGRPAPLMRYDEMCIGESVKSMKQLLNRYTRAGTKVAPASASPSFYPWNIGKTKVDATGLIQGEGPRDVFAAISGMYAMYRGSMKIGMNLPHGSAIGVSALVSPSGPPSTYAFMSNAVPLAGVSTVTATNTSLSGSLGFSLTQNSSCISYFEVPYYNSTYATWIQRQTATAYTNVNTLPLAILSVSRNDGVVVGQITRACSDNFQFCYFLGAPPVYVSIA